MQYVAPLTGVNLEDCKLDEIVFISVSVFFDVFKDTFHTSRMIFYLDILNNIADKKLNFEFAINFYSQLNVAKVCKSYAILTKLKLKSTLDTECETKWHAIVLYVSIIFFNSKTVFFLLTRVSLDKHVLHIFCFPPHKLF